MKHPLIVPDHSDVVVSATSPIRHRCPHVDELDFGHITITWRVKGKTYELHSLAEYLRGFEHSVISHEELTDSIRHHLSVVNEIELISVESTWNTADMEVSCSTSPTPVALKSSRQ